MSATVLRDEDIINKPQRLRSYADIILKESSQLSAQVERVLQMAQSDKGKMVLQKETIVWQEILQAVKAVSYTHLDVYKRQCMYKAAVPVEFIVATIFCATIALLPIPEITSRPLH